MVVESLAAAAGSGYSGLMSASPQSRLPAKPKEKWWKLGLDADRASCRREEPHDGNPCPDCLLGELRYNGLFQLICDHCGRVAEAAVFT